jgi:hypothetical protein
MLFYPGGFSQFLAVGVFFVILALLGKIYWQKFEIRNLETSIIEVKQELLSSKLREAALQENVFFYRDNLKFLDQYLRRKPKPPVLVNGDLKVDMLFIQEPRK